MNCHTRHKPVIRWASGSPLTSSWKPAISSSWNTLARASVVWELRLYGDLQMEGGLMSTLTDACMQTSVPEETIVAST